MRTITCLSFFLLLFAAQAQHRRTDSLRGVWEDRSRPDTVRMVAFSDLIWQGYLFSDPDSALILCDSLYRYAMKKGCKANAGDACSMLGIRCMVLGDFDGALKHLEESRELYEEAHNAQGAIGVLTNMGNAYWKKGDLSRAIDMYMTSLRGMEKMGDRRGIAVGELNVGLIYSDLQDTLRAIQHFQTALQRFTEFHNDDGIGEADLNLGGKVAQQGDTTRSLAYMNAARVAFEHSGNNMYLSQTLTSMGRMYAAMHRFDEARTWLNKSLEVAKPMGAGVKVAPLIALAELWKDEGQWDKAIVEGEAVRPLTDSSGTLDDAKNLYLILADSYKAAGRPALALERYEHYHSLQDSLVNDQNKSGLLRQEYKYTYDKKVLSDSLSYAAQKTIQEKEIQKQKLVRNGFMAGFGFVGLFAMIFFVQRNRISKARKRSDELLLNILPEEVAEELKNTGAAAAKHFDTATILFTDFKGFTALSEKLSPAELVEELNVCFKAFDHIITARGIEKIKTIGDAYMCAGGLPDPKTSSPTDVVRAALEMQAFMAQHIAEREAQGKPFFEMRVGIHTGPVVAGIVGVKKFAYDIWGDTVNIASRMESSGEVGQVNISESTFALVKNMPGLTFTPRGKVQAKGKGEMEMYFVEGDTSKAHVHG